MKPLHVESKRKTYTTTSHTGENVELSLHCLKPDDIGVELQNHEHFSTLAIHFGNVKVNCFVWTEARTEEQICTSNLAVIDTLINALIDAELDLRLQARQIERKSESLASTGEQQ
jgi:hypothetical protein